MTIKELLDLLAEYPEETKVSVLRERRPLGSGGSTLEEIEISISFDQDTNIGSVVISPKVDPGEYAKELEHYPCYGGIN